MMNNRKSANDDADYHPNNNTNNNNDSSSNSSLAKTSSNNNYNTNNTNNNPALSNGPAIPLNSGNAAASRSNNNNNSTSSLSVSPLNLARVIMNHNQINKNINDNNNHNQNQNQDAAEQQRIVGSPNKQRVNKRRQREEVLPDGSSSRLQSSSTVEEFVAALQQIVSNNDSRDRSEQVVSIILTSKIQLIRSNHTNQILLEALGAFFMWMVPGTKSLTSAEREAQEKEQKRGRKICSSQDVEDLFVRHLLPSAKSSRAVCSFCVSVSRIAWTTDNTYFVTAAARDELLKLAKSAPCVDSFLCALQAISILANNNKDGVPIKSNPFVCDEVSTIAHKWICESSIPQIVQLAADLLRIQVARSTPQFCATDPDFAQTMLRKLDEAMEAETISSIASLIGQMIYKKQFNMQLFASGEAARVFLSKLKSSEDPELLRHVCRCINNAAATLKNISDDFASPEMCRAIFKCFSQQEDEIDKGEIFRLIATLVRFLPRARSTFAQEWPDLTQAIIATLTSATDDETRYDVACVVAYISLDDDSSRRLFNNFSLYDALILAASRTHDEETKTVIIIAMHNATSVCTDFLPLCAARFPFYDARQIELLQLDSLESLVSDLKNNGWMFVAPSKATFMELRSILIVLEKCDQFLEVVDRRMEGGDVEIKKGDEPIEEGGAKIKKDGETIEEREARIKKAKIAIEEREARIKKAKIAIEEMLLTIAEGFVDMIRAKWSPLLEDPFVDVTLSLLERSSGAANVVFVCVIYSVVTENLLFTIHPSTMLRLLQKLDNSKELRDREYNRAKMEFFIYKILETVALRSPDLFRDNNFLVDNSALIRSCFERSFEIHEFDAHSEEKSMLKTHVEALCKVEPRMKEEMEGWNRGVRYVA